MFGENRLTVARHKMKFFGKNKKKEQRNEAPQSPILPSAFAQHAAELAGMTPEEILKLLQSLGRINESITVTRRRPEKSGKGSKVVGGRKGRMTIDEAVEHGKIRIEERDEKEKTVRELFGLQVTESDRDEFNEDVYPKRLAPTDIVRCVDAAEKRLDENDRLEEKRKKVFSPREENILNIINEIKKHEAVRLTQKIAERQRQAVYGKTIEELDAERKLRFEVFRAELKRPPTPEELEQQRIEEELEAGRTLVGFDGNLRTLTDEAAELTSDNPDAAAAVVRQWIGNAIAGD